MQNLETVSVNKDSAMNYNDIAECFVVPEYFENPYKYFKYFRENKPVYFSPITGSWHFYRYEDIAAIYRDKRFERGDNSYVNQLGKEAARSIGGWMQWKVGKDHLGMRSALQEPFTKPNIAKLTDHVTKAVDDLLESMPESGEYDIFNEYLYKLPVLIICDILGIPRKDFSLFVKWSAALATVMDPAPSPEKIEMNNKVILDMEAYFKPLFAQKLEEPGPDLISKLMANMGTPKGMSYDDIMIHVIMMFFAGHETTTNQIAFGLIELLKNKDQWELLKNNESYVDSAVEEILRHQTSVSFIQYRAQEDLVFAGHQMPMGSFVWVFLPAANRDPQAYENPDKFDILRKMEKPHYAFGKGAHQCLGADLSRLEMKLTLLRLIKKLNGRSIELKSYQNRPSLFLRGVENVIVKIG